MRIALITQWNDDFAEIAKITVPVMQEYCLRHGYSFYAMHCTESPHEIIMKRSRFIASMYPRYGAVVHVDADCLLTNLRIKIGDIAPLDQDWHVAASGNGKIINDGVSIWRKDDTTEAFLSNHAYDCFRGAILQDAVAMDDSLKVFNPPAGLINACLKDEYEPPMPDDVNWEWGNFCLHLLAMSNQRRIELLNKHLPFILR